MYLYMYEIPDQVTKYIKSNLAFKLEIWNENAGGSKEFLRRRRL